MSTSIAHEADTEVAERKSFYLPAGIKQMGERLARQRLRSFSNYVAWLIAQDAKRVAEGDHAGDLIFDDFSTKGTLTGGRDHDTKSTAV